MTSYVSLLPVCWDVKPSQSANNFSDSGNTRPPMERGHHCPLWLSLMPRSPLGVNVFVLVPWPKGLLHAIPTIYPTPLLVDRCSAPWYMEMSHRLVTQLFKLLVGSTKAWYKPKWLGLVGLVWKNEAGTFVICNWSSNILSVMLVWQGGWLMLPLSMQVCIGWGLGTNPFLATSNWSTFSSGPRAAVYGSLELHSVLLPLASSSLVW